MCVGERPVVARDVVELHGALCLDTLVETRRERDLRDALRPELGNEVCKGLLHRLLALQPYRRFHKRQTRLSGLGSARNASNSEPRGRGPMSASRGSAPAMQSEMSATSSTERANTPTVSSGGD